MTRLLQTDLWHLGKARDVTPSLRNPADLKAWETFSSLMYAYYLLEQDGIDYAPVFDADKLKRFEQGLQVAATQTANPRARARLHQAASILRRMAHTETEEYSQ